jgi:ornithine cyclodeaminase
LHGNGASINPNSYFLRFPDQPSNRIIALPAALGGEFDVSGIKWIASFPTNVQRGIPRASAVLVLNDTRTGYPFACLESSIISASRTAASAVLAAEAIRGSRAGVRTLGIVGTGLIARYVYEFLIGTGWEIDRVALFDLVPSEAERFRSTVCDVARHRQIAIAPSCDALMRESDLIVFATVAGKPHVHDRAALAHNPVVLHVSLRDLAPELLLEAENIVDDIGHVLNADTSPHLAEKLSGGRAFLRGTLAQLLQGQARTAPDRPVIFSPFGLGVLDLAVGKWVYDLARARGQLTDVPGFFFDLSR